VAGPVEASSSRWTTVADSPHDHEREALAFLRRHLPDRDPYRVWANFEFVAPNGALYEVDALAITDNGIHLIEIKSHPGSIGGDASTWQWTTPKGKYRLFDNPRLLANRKAKALREVLGRTKEFTKRRNDVPWVSETVFLSDPDVEVTLSPPGRFQVYGRDAEKGQELPSQRKKIGGVVEALTTLEPDRSGRPRKRIDRPFGARIARAVEQAGIRERTSRKRVGDYRVVELIDDVEADQDTGVAYQDFLVDHISLTGVRRRLRLYPLELNATTEQREAAARAAKREFEHLHPLRHPGILAPFEYVEHDRGPGLLFDVDPAAQRLDRWLHRTGHDQFSVADRLSLIRSLAEALAHAHERGVYHRALCPSAVLVTEPEETSGNGQSSTLPAVAITNWHAGARIGTGDSPASFTGTQHVDALAGGDAALYRAPEHAQPLADPAKLDMFSLGCLACFLLTGAPPAAMPAKLDEMLATTGYVAASVAGDAIDDSLELFIAALTDKDPADRPGAMLEVLEFLDGIEEEWTAPDEIEEVHVTAARRGATLCDERFEVLGRIGMGSTAFALLVQDRAKGGRMSVLKVASKPELNDRIEAEGAALGKLNHPSIVQFLEDEPLDLDGHAALLLSYAGPKVSSDRSEPDTDEREERAPRSLASRIGEPLGAELAQRWGEDLLEALRHLEQMGVAHRDIKPENLGVAPRGDKDELHLVLFDFSLAGAPVDQTEAGTPGYRDPFLRYPERRQWDPAAERYAAAVVLYEICTGTKPIYGDGKGDPFHTGAPLTIDPELFEPSVAGGLERIFRCALDPDAKERYGTADDMLWAWREAFRPAAQVAAVSLLDQEVPEFTVPSGTTRSTPLAGLPLSNRAINALEREDILTVGDLLDTPLNRVTQLRGVGALTRRELRSAVDRLSEAMALQGEITEDAPLTVAAQMLVPRVSKNEGARAAVLRHYLGLDGDTRVWPSQSDLAGTAGVTPARVSQILSTARNRWSKQPPVTGLRNWVAGELASLGDIASVSQLVDRLARSREHEDAGDEARHRAATALARASLAVEADRTSPRWVRRIVRDSAMVVARHSDEGVDGNMLADYASALADRTGELISESAVVPRAELVAALGKIDPPEGARPLPDAHLAELAASLCPSAAMNSRLELYRRGLPAEDALRASRRAFVAVEKVTPDALIGKVQARFSEAEQLPDRPRLDRLLESVDLDLRFDKEAGHYTPPAPAVSVSSGSPLSRYETGVPTRSVTPVEIDEAADFEDRLRRAVDSGGLLVLVTDRRHLREAAKEVARLPVTIVDVDEWLIAEVERLTEDGRPSWQLVVDADAAGPGSVAWQNLTRLVERAIAGFTDRLAAASGTVLLTNCGLLARYDRLDVVATWREMLHRGDAALDALWLLVATSGASDVPLLDGKAVPVLTRNEWTRIPPDWLRNVHRAGVAR
jgi:serine/threonine protein kinase